MADIAHTAHRPQPAFSLNASNPCLRTFFLHPHPRPHRCAHAGLRCTFAPRGVTMSTAMPVATAPPPPATSRQAVNSPRMKPPRLSAQAAIRCHATPTAATRRAPMTRRRRPFSRACSGESAVPTYRPAGRANKSAPPRPPRPLPAQPPATHPRAPSALVSQLRPDAAGQHSHAAGQHGNGARTANTGAIGAQNAAPDAASDGGVLGEGGGCGGVGGSVKGGGRDRAGATTAAARATVGGGRRGE